MSADQSQLLIFHRKGEIGQHERLGAKYREAVRCVLYEKIKPPCWSEGRDSQLSHQTCHPPAGAQESSKVIMMLTR